jgi:hypothetical protein
MTSLPILYLSDLMFRERACRADVISNGDDRWTITYWLRGGRQRTEETAPCRIILPHEERKP